MPRRCKKCKIIIEAEPAPPPSLPPPIKLISLNSQTLSDGDTIQFDPPTQPLPEGVTFVGDGIDILSPVGNNMGGFGLCLSGDFSVRVSEGSGEFKPEVTAPFTNNMGITVQPGFMGTINSGTFTAEDGPGAPIPITYSVKFRYSGPGITIFGVPRAGEEVISAQAVITVLRP